LTLVCSRQIGAVLPDQEERVRIRNEKIKFDENMNLYKPRVKSILARRPSGGFDPITDMSFSGQHAPQPLFRL